MNIALFAGTFSLSGVPLAQYKLARAFSEDGHNVDLIYGKILDKINLPSSKKFKIINFNKNRVSYMFFKIARYLHEKKPDIVFSAGDHLNAIVLLAAILTNSKSKISCSSRVTPFDTYSNNLLSKGWLLKIIMKMVIYRADVLTCVSKDMINQYKALFKNTRHIPIYNIVKDQYSEGLMLEHLSKEEEVYFNKKKIVITAGMLEPWKRQEDIIYAFNLLKEKNDLNLLILGEGSQKNKLNDIIKRLNLKNSVFCLGNVKNPLKYFAKSNVFVLSSRVEGLPNVLVEAMMCGCTPVSTNCPTGPREVLQDGKYGYLVDVGNIEQISKSIHKALNYPISKENLKDAIQEFREEKVIEKHFISLEIYKNKNV
tara:strand:+ start:8102 stop:9208 length:1107 start_codon:yes stop_codon:yes gene_type:complete